MKLLRENFFIVIWMVILTILVSISLFKVKVHVTLHTPSNAQVSVTTNEGGAQ